MNDFSIKPYKLFNKIQHYDWGTKNDDAFIPKFLGIDVLLDLPYAELWIGAHPKAPSEVEVNGNKISLIEFIDKNILECLGEYVAKKFNNKFPFLLKVLSANNALSIQTHPNKKDAEKFHAKDPANYPDDNHKPEIAIAFDFLSAIAGFRPVDEIIENIKSLVELNELVDEKYLKNLLDAENDIKKKNYLRELYSAIMMKSKDTPSLSLCIAKICERLSAEKKLSLEERQFLKQYELYGFDVGLFSFFFFNMIELKSGQAIFTGAGIPHAYLKGNIIECMANSDNVIRAGLTNKFKDVDALLEIIKYDFKKYNIINSAQLVDEVVYKTPAEEFEVIAFSKELSFNRNYCSNDKPSVYLIAKGEVEIKWNSDGKNNSVLFKSGDSFFMPACLKDYKICTYSQSKYFKVEIPS